MECENCGVNQAVVNCFCSGVYLCEPCFEIHKEMLSDDDHDEFERLEVVFFPENREELEEGIQNMRAKRRRLEEFSRELSKNVAMKFASLIHAVDEYRRNLEERKQTDIVALEDVKLWGFEFPDNLKKDIEGALDRIKHSK